MVTVQSNFFTAQLRLTTAPTYYHFPPTGKRKPEDRFDVGRSVVTVNRVELYLISNTFAGVILQSWLSSGCLG